MPQTENASREKILARIRTALREPAPRHEPSEARAIFAPVTGLLERFQKECEINITECVVTPDLRTAAGAVKQVLVSIPDGEIFVQDSPDLRQLASEWQGARVVQWSSEGAPKESSQATISACEALVAQTGSVLVSAACGGRGASVVAAVHVVVATIDQLVPDISAAFARVQERGIVAQNSFLCLITGSSRTADIEKILVMGAHGPRRLIVVLAMS
ncbi:MAG: LUD domain-containing protein [Candidatus Acidiferrales bacterium]